MRRKTLYILLLAVVSLTFVAGCKGWLIGSQPYQDVKYYGLQAPVQLPYEGVKINVLMLKMLAATKNKMLYREESCTILQDEYNKWIQPPNLMLRQYLQNAFGSEDKNMKFGDVDTYYLSGSIGTFEINLQSGEVVLGMDFRLQSVLTREVVLEDSRVVKEKYREQTPEAFAEAMSKCADQLSRIVMKAAVELHKKAKETGRFKNLETINPEVMAN